MPRTSRNLTAKAAGCPAAEFAVEEFALVAGKDRRRSAEQGRGAGPVEVFGSSGCAITAHPAGPGVRSPG
ncbi:hypothetical protein [Nocardia sp. NPDC058705]|uniref:hypothetical protein n=1 Tax=Nocardia sp. NPDC058705 TaxID=3346609 RepID=UPI0036B607C9